MRENACIARDHSMAWYGTGVHQQWDIAIAYSLIIQKQILKYVCPSLFYLSFWFLGFTLYFSYHSFLYLIHMHGVRRVQKHLLYACLPAYLTD